MIRNPDEAIAVRYLQQAGLVACHEPKGVSTFPDFDICNAMIGIEVRCVPFTQHGQSMAPLETASSSLWERTKQLLIGLDRSELSTSYIVRLQFMRPIPEWCKVEKAIKVHLAKPIEDLCCSIRPIAENISISVGRLNHKDRNTFLFGGNTDRDWGCFVVAATIEGIQKSVVEKTATESKNRPHGYQRLWLILVNRMDQHLTPDEVADITGEVNLSAPWERIILLSPDATMLAEWNATPPACEGSQT